MGWLRTASEHLPDTAADDRIFARLQHPDPDHECVCVRRNALVSRLSAIGVQLDGGLAFAQRCQNLFCRYASHGWVETYEYMRDMVRDLGNDRLGGDGGYPLDRCDDQVSALLIVPLHGFLCMRKNPVDGCHHANDLFLGHLHAAAHAL